MKSAHFRGALQAMGESVSSSSSHCGFVFGSQLKFHNLEMSVPFRFGTAWAAQATMDRKTNGFRD